MAMEKLKVLDLFSGIGGFSLGLERTGGFETIAFCEIEKFPQKVLAKHWPGIKIYEDVRNVTAQQLAADGLFPDVITGGFPCQDISVAGNQAGIGEGTRSGLWSECARLVGEIRPDYAIFENVTALLSGDGGRWFQRVLFDLSSVGYDAEWHCISASELGAHHHRDRVWIIAYPRSERREGLVKNIGISGRKRTAHPFTGDGNAASQFALVVCGECLRKDNGVRLQLHRSRLKGLGNAVVPQIPELIGRAILRHQETGR